MLVVYVAAILLVQNLGTKLLMNGDTAKTLLASLDVPTMLVLVVYAGLSFRQELTKPKYNIPKKSRWLIDTTLSGMGVAAFGALLIIKYVL